MTLGHFTVPAPLNEPVKDYARGSAERVELDATLDSMAKERIEIPVRVGSKRVLSGDRTTVCMPHDHGHVLADLHQAKTEHVDGAIKAALQVAPASVERVSRMSTSLPSVAPNTNSATRWTSSDMIVNRGQGVVDPPGVQSSDASDGS